MDSEIQLNCESQAMEVRRVRVLELFSGVGGMHRALEQALEGEQGEVVAAMDINTVSNQIYLHNHPGTNLLNRCIEAYKIQVRDRNKVYGLSQEHCWVDSEGAGEAGPHSSAHVPPLSGGCKEI